MSTAKSIQLEKVSLIDMEILGLLNNKMAADGEYPILNRDNLTISIQMQLSQKQKYFSKFLAAYLKFSWDFKYFEKKGDPRRFCIFEIIDSENVVR